MALLYPVVVPCSVILSLILIITGWEVAIRECEWSRKRPHSVLMSDTRQMWAKQQIAKRKLGVAPTEPDLHPRTDFCTQMHPMQNERVIAK